MAGASEKRQVVRYAFYKLDPAWRRLTAERQASAKIEFGETLERYHGRLLLRPYGLVVQPSAAKYLFVYPFIKTRGWYALPKQERQRMMDEHVRIGRTHPTIRLNTTYSYGLDDQEFIVAFEGDNPGEFLDLVMELRESEASSYTARDTPTFTCVQMSLWDMLDTLGGASAAQAVARRPTRADGFTPVASLSELPPGSAKRVYAANEAVALFNVNGTVYAVGNRCTHARASLSEGKVDAAHCTVTCPWHEGVFSLETGRVLGGPPVHAVATFQVKVDGDTILIAPPSPHVEAQRLTVS